MYKFLTRKGGLVAIGIGLISVLIAMGTMINGVTSNYSMSDDLNSIMKSNPEANFDFINPAISVVIGLIAIAFIAALLFGILGLFSDPKGAIKFLIGAALMLGLFFILSNAGGEESAKITRLMEKFDVSDGVGKFIGGGVKTAVIGIAAAFIFAAVMEIWNLFK